MTHQSHHLISYRLGGDELPRLLTGGFACYQIYATADDRFLTVGALEPKFFQCLCQLIGQPELAGRQYDLASQPEMIETLSSLFRRRALDDWLQLFDGEEVAVGPVQTLAEAHAAFGEPEPAAPLAEPGEHTVAWRTELRVGHRD